MGTNGNGVKKNGMQKSGIRRNGAKNGAHAGIVVSADERGALEIRDAYRGKHLLVTGVTGFLGKVWMTMLLDHVEDVGRLTVVVRGKKGEDARARFDWIVESSPALRPLRAKYGSELWTIMAEKVDVLDARLVEPLCGLDPDAAAELMKDVDAVVHFAGLTDFEPDPRHAIDANIHGARHAADLAALSPSGRYVHVSTTFVAGLRNDEIPESIEVGVGPTGVVFDPEEELAALEAGLVGLDKKSDRVDFAMARGQALGWPNIYTYTKGLSEHLLEGREDVVTTTFRPAIVECAQNYPFVGWNEGINTSGPIIWLLGTSFQRFPAKASNHFDIVPVDTVSRAMMVVVAAALTDSARPVYQCASSHMNPFTYERAVDMSGIALRRIHRKSEDSWERNVLARLDSHCVEDVDREQVLGFRRMRLVARATRSFLREFDLSKNLSPKLYDRIDGERVDADLRSFSMKCRTADRKLGQVDEMLRQYRPFIWDLNYTFLTDHLAEEDERLSDEERVLFGFDVPAICWRHYWVNIQVPGLDLWSLPLLRGEKVPDDEPLPRPTSEPDLRQRTGEVPIVRPEDVGADGERVAVAG